MLQRIAYFWQVIRSSFWFVPLLIVVMGAGLAVGFALIDDYQGATPVARLPILFTASADSARTILATIAGAMVGVAGTVFSITLVALTLASSQFGSRLLRTFMHDRLNQVVLGTYIGTFIYCLLVLSTVRATDEVRFVPQLSVLFAITLAVANILLLIIFIHHISIGIQADKVIADISGSIWRSVEMLFPEQMGEESEEPEKVDLDSWRRRYPQRTEVQAARSGYIQVIDGERLLSLAKKQACLIEIFYRPGEFLVRDMPFARIFHGEELPEEVPTAIRNSLILGRMRTSMQDVEFAIHQLVEIAAKALSPGINDPYTAIACIDYLTATLSHLSTVRFPSGPRFDEEEQLRLMAKPYTFAGMMDAAFFQIRQYGEGNPAVLIRLMEALVTIGGSARRRYQLETVQRHADMVLRAGENSMKEPNDLQDLVKRYEQVPEQVP